jgi:hypothetical protein
VNRKKTAKEKVPVCVLVPAPLQRAIAEKALKNGRSFSAEVRQAIKKDLKLDGAPM